MVKKVSHRRFRTSWFIGIVMLVATLLLAWHFFTLSDASHPFFARRVQKSVLRLDNDMQSFQASLVNRQEIEELLSDANSRYELLNDHPSFVFRSDSLLFWNTNLLEPKVLHKRVPVSCDTIVNLATGDFLVSSFQLGAYSIYLLSHLTTSYPFENEFFVNRFLHLSGKRVVQFGCSNSEEAFPAYSAAGRLLSYFSLSQPASLHERGQAFPTACAVVILLCFYLLCCRWFTLRIPIASPPARPSRHGFLIPLLTGLVLVLAMFFSFRALCHVFFEHGFFIPGTMRLNRFFLYLLLYGLTLLTLVLLQTKLLLRNTSFSIRNEFLLVVFQLLCCGMLLTYIYDKEYSRFENDQVTALAADLADERDPAFEESYCRFLAVAQHDTTFFTTLLSEDVMEVVAEDYMRSFLFDSVMNQYSVTATLCSSEMELEVQPSNEVTDCNSYFFSKVVANHGVGLDEGLYFLDYNTLDPSYLSTFNFQIGDSISDRTVYLEFSKPIAPPGFGLPKILHTQFTQLPPGYSVACYQDSLLVYKYGSYVYPNYLSDFRHQPNEFIYGRKLKHYTFQANDSKVVAISLQRRGWMQLTSPFVVFFFLLFFLFLLIYFLGGVRRHYPTYNTLSNKIQMLVLIALGISFLVVCPVSVLYMRGFYTQKSRDYHFERTRTLLLDITGEVDFSFLKEPGFKYALDEILKHYSETFFTDINIYGLNGKMLATTSPELIDLHLLSSLMDAEAYHNLQGERSLYYIHDEQLGKVVYQSAYIPIQDANGKNLAYLNTPYFASRSELQSEILNYILTYVNIILLIIFVILFVVLWRTRRLTDPLLRLQEKMRQIDLNKSNEQLEWTSNDEIGALVNQYNQLVVELEKSAAELRRTTTESAWRGVARQVAHEIKNSLTPMRLSVQLLQRNIEQGGDEIGDKVRRTTNTLLEQIDALSDIASSFSTYAKLPENHPQPFDLAELVQNLVNLYDNEEHIEIRYEVDPTRDYTFNGDKTNMNSAVGNILKNAVQAIGNAPDGLIVVKLQEVRDHFVISIKDNGKGIKEADKPMIFLPNFTTKSSGSGVGLSLTYNIIRVAGGTIDFESTEGKGAEFVIKLPKS